jgi:hypothetical protein
MGRRGQTQPGGEQQLPAGKPFVRCGQLRTECTVDVAILTGCAAEKGQLQITLGQ